MKVIKAKLTNTGDYESTWWTELLGLTFDVYEANKDEYKFKNSKKNKELAISSSPKIRHNYGREFNFSGTCLDKKYFEVVK